VLGFVVGWIGEEEMWGEIEKGLPSGGTWGEALGGCSLACGGPTSQ
jgi:hypothetical protein